MLYGHKAVAEQKFQQRVEWWGVVDVNAQPMRQKTLPGIYKFCQCFKNTEPSLLWTFMLYQCVASLLAVLQGLAASGLRKSFKTRTHD